MIGTASDAIGSWLQDTLGLTHWTLIAGIIVLVFLKFGFDKNQISIKVFISKNRLLLIVCALAVAGIIWDAFMAGNRSEPVENPASTASLTLRPTPTFAPSPAAALVSVGDTVRFGSYEWRVLDV
ncbi:MAG: hypothetical protein LBU67_07715, partial [Oscillospiraceae bacterium]|nr:hypothetical protein [Oscillospiraceae bacterium]